MGIMDQTAFAKISCEEFCRVLASKEPAPGGGGASALAGALAVSLGNMVGNLTVGKKKYAAYEEEITEANERAGRLRLRFLELIQEDGDSFAPLAAVYRLPSGTDEEKAEKNRRLQRALFDACIVPEQIMDCCMETLDLVDIYEKKGSVMAVSDAAAAALLGKGALMAAALNLRINARSMEDRERAKEILDRMEAKLVTGEALADEIYRRALEKL
jgi:formiminotetrahydrofolate cyclodeaminase